ncbi:hypothetical protein HMPREF0989_04821 [Ralstonia sp. 5_2_56FAA]|nr:hypothetical protein HMPREF0989_04821 [Ralstonia sp. 5_2_56FAA]
MADYRRWIGAACCEALRPLPPKLATGSHLIRVWQGETHQVTVLEDG